MSFQIGKVLFSLLTANAALTAKVGNKIYPLIVTNETEYPFIVYKRYSIEPAYTRDGISSEKIGMTILVCSDVYSETTEIADLVVASLNGKSGKYLGMQINDIRLVSGDEEYQDDIYIQSINITINITIL